MKTIFEVPISILGAQLTYRSFLITSEVLLNALRMQCCARPEVGGRKVGLTPNTSFQLVGGNLQSKEVVK